MSRRRSTAASCRLATPGSPCCFCGLSENNEIEYGKLYELGTIVTHYYCLLLSSMMQQRGRDDQGILGFLAVDIEKELRRGKRLVCFHCKKAGATLGCCNTKCKRIFHLPCGLKAGSLHQFYNEFRSFCINHRPKQLIDGRVLEEVKNAETLCYICLDDVNYRDILAMLWAPCCKKNAFFHRKCVQQLANSSGYFFKCPLCNNKKEFQDAMLEHGIFIPSQDASWELVPNAYHELLYRHNQCDADTCVCPKGRNHTSSNAGPTNKWELVLCRMCGSQGIHKHCGHLKWANSSWVCGECQSILDKSPIVNRQIREPGVAEGNGANGEADFKDGDSDSDLSVGQDSNQQTDKSSENPDSENIPTVKVRPGPLSYKMKEVMKVAQSTTTKDSSSSLEGMNSSTSLTESENGDKKIVDDPNTVILLDSDEEPEDIEIISEKLNPKVLTTNDGKKIEILDKRGIEELAKSVNQAIAETPASAIPSLTQKDSKPTITSIQTVNSSPNSKNANQFANLRNLNSQSLNPRSAAPQMSRIINQPGPRIISEQTSNPRNVNPPVSNPGTAAPQNFNQRVMNSQIPTFKVISNPRYLNSQISNQDGSQIFNPRATPQNFSQRSMTPQFFYPRNATPQTSNPRNTQPQTPNPQSQTLLKHFPSPRKQTTPVKQVSSPAKQIPTPTNNLSSPDTNFPFGVQNSEVRTQGRALPTNVPQFFPPAMIPAKEEDSMGIKITSVCSLPPDFFDNLETEVQDSKSAGTSASFSNSFMTEPSGDFNLKRKAEIQGPSQYFEKQSLDMKRTRILDQRTFQVSGYGKQKMVADFKSEEMKGKKELNSVTSDGNKEFVDKYPILRRNLVEEAMAKANITQNDMISAEINVKNNEPSTSSVHTTVNNYVAMPSSNMTFYMGNGESQEVLKVAGKKAGGCISWDSSNSVKGMQAPVLVFSPGMVFQSIPPTKSEFKQKIKSPQKQIHESETTHSKTPNLATYAVQTQRAAVNSQKHQAPVIQLD